MLRFPNKPHNGGAKDGEVEMPLGMSRTVLADKNEFGQYTQDVAMDLTGENLFDPPRTRLEMVSIAQVGNDQCVNDDEVLAQRQHDSHHPDPDASRGSGTSRLRGVGSLV